MGFGVGRVGGSGLLEGGGGKGCGGESIGCRVTFNES